MFPPVGVIQQAANAPAIPANGLLCSLDGSVASSFWSDIGKTTNSTEGGSVAVWEDQSGNGNDWTQSNASYRPTAHLASGRLYSPGSGGSGPSYHLVGPNISAWTTGTFFARFQLTTGIQGGIWGTTSWNNGSSGNHWGYISDTHYVCFGTSVRYTPFNWSGQAETAYDLMTYEESLDAGGLTRIFINGTLRATTTSTSPTFRTAPYLGCLVRSNGPEYSLGGHFYKFCAYNRVVNAGERTEINTWLES